MRGIVPGWMLSSTSASARRSFGGTLLLNNANTTISGVKIPQMSAKGFHSTGSNDCVDNLIVKQSIV